MTWTDIRIHGTNNLIIFESEEILWNQKSRDESKAAFIWEERRCILLLFFKGKVQGAISTAHEKGSELDKSREMYDLNQEVIQEKK